MPETGNDQSRLRIGGWIRRSGPPGRGITDRWSDRPDTGPQWYEPAGLLRHRAAAPPPPPVTLPPTAWPSGVSPAGADLAGRQSAVVVRRTGPDTPAGVPSRSGLTDRARPRRALLMGGVALVALTGVVAVTALYAGTSQEPVRGEFVAGVPSGADFPANGGAPYTVEGLGSGTPERSATPSGPADGPTVQPGLNPRAAGTDHDASTPATAGSTPASAGSTPAKPATSSTAPAPAAPTSPAGPTLTPGARIGLELAGRPGHRVRHAFFEARVDRVDAGSDTGTKADAAFVVRAGLGTRSCVSFESVNFPGHYLRHHEFRVFLHRADGSADFAADATFCPVPGLGGAHTSLRTTNHPEHYLRHDARGQMRISRVGDGASAATATFRVRPAL
ncbi:AbfB domain-containing protein [Micromonospora sp. WMMA1923]|uniref:AbfB domain-containing protein n=1 Tax=Micromonospora sp. WMMA1923 TaxID=3404125 RepID=UPI003B934D97